MEPGHAGAKKLSEASSLALQLKAFQSEAENCFAEKRYDCVAENTAAMLRLEPANEVAQTLARQASALQTQDQTKNADNLKRYQESLSAAEKCFSAGDYECSMRYAKQALLYRPAESNAESLYQKASYAQGRQQEALGSAKKALEQGAVCFKQKNYSCAIAKSESALEFSPGFKEAIQLKQDAQNEVTRLKQSIKIQ